MAKDFKTERLKRRQAIADRLRRARVSNDQTMDDAARAAEVHLQTWFRWENAMQAIPSDVLPIVARAVKKTAIELLGMAA